jgi:hypothetical protein
LIGKRNVLCAFVAAFALQAGAQDVAITGTVTDAAGSGVAGATVSLMFAGISTFTGSGGTFALLRNTGVRTMQEHAALGSAFVAGGAIRFFVAEPAAVRIDVYSMSGRLVSTALDRTLGRGAYSLTPAAEGMRSGLYIVKVRIGAWSTVCRMSLCGSSAAGSGLRMRADAAGRPHARKAAGTDTLIAAKCGYNTLKTFISSYTLSNQQCVLTGSGACQQSGCTNPVFVTSNPNGGWSDSGYYVHNNMWNSAYVLGPETLYACSYHNWYVVSNQTNNAGAVKTYPNVHKDYNNVAISSFNTITSTFAATSPHVGIYDVAYDIWTNGVATSGSTEFMIWTENYNQVPSGNLAATVIFGGRTYNVWKTSNNGYIAFVPTVVFTSGTVDLLEIFKWTMSKGWFPSNSTVGQIDFGVEIVSTNGANATFKCTDFSITTN